MTNKDVLITIKSIQSNDDDKSEIEVITQGVYQKTKEGFIITYDESDESGFDGASTTITTKHENEVSVQRTGSASSNLVIEKGKKHHCHYQTPFGDLMVGITTKKIKSSLADKGGDLYLNYVVDINSSYVAEHELMVNIK